MTRRRKHEEITDADKRRILKLRVECGLPFSTIASRFGTTPETIGRLVAEAQDVRTDAKGAK